VFFAGSSGNPQRETIDGRTIFEVGSVTKTFTAMLVSDAIQRGELTFDQRVETVLPGHGLDTQERPSHSKYSNLGFAVLGRVLEARTGSS
jgi:CubicO group peptidase (beta-lactamase class C family)